MVPAAVSGGGLRHKVQELRDFPTPAPLHKREGKPSARQELKLDWLNGDVSELRSAYEQACRIDTDPCRWIDIGADKRQLRVLIHEPARPRSRDCAIIYFHGGGWIVGSPATHADISKPCARKPDCVSSRSIT